MSNIDLVVKGGKIATSHGIIEGNLYVSSGRVVAIGRLDVPAAEVVDADGLFVLPGFIDSHVHFMDPGDLSREDFPTGSAAAAAAGVTTVIEHSHVYQIHTAEQLVEKAEYLANRSVVDFGLAAHFSPHSVDDVVNVWAAGATFIKVFTCTTHGVQAVETARLAEAMKRLAGRDAVYLVHGEDESLTEHAERVLKARSQADGGVIPQWRSLLAEQVAVASVGMVSRALGGRVVFAHCSHPSVVEIISTLRNWGAKVWAETCPQYLYLFEDEVRQFGAFRKFTPPARAQSEADLGAMWQLLRDGQIAYVASDHAPSTREQKESASIWEAPFGLPGIDTTSALLLDAALTGRISILRFVELYSREPARIYGLYPRKGALLPGSDADFVLVDPSARRVIRDETILSKAKWSPFSGKEVQGAVVATYLRGKKVAENREVLAPPGSGRFLPGPGARGG
ncbi:dihydroorotase family protein [Thermaerobacter composti]|uniref:Dihydroorotase family protein n=1 Tax=Thermaerobacter composti TaxID=554949 RepID=A0ABZ0QPB3_9FIRM|nr:dihydroorotase family protein [Thermaerobacter composti]WPD18519.1 dihydroorotase family protein [Thermaerobacter composti]